MLALEKILNDDKYAHEFDNANTALTISALCLNKCTVHIVDVNRFIESCNNVAKVLIKYNKKEKLLALYLWTRNKLTKLFLKGNTGTGVRINCHSDANIIDEKIKALCNEMAGNNVLPLLRKLTMDQIQQEPTTTHK